MYGDEICKTRFTHSRESRRLQVIDDTDAKVTVKVKYVMPQNKHQKTLKMIQSKSWKTN